MFMAKKQPLSPLAIFIIAIIVVSLVAIAVSSVTHTTLALKQNDQGKSGNVGHQCIMGLENAAIETGNCTLDELGQFEDIMIIRETQGVKAAKEACFSTMTSKGCRGLCVAAINCYYLP